MIYIDTKDNLLTLTYENGAWILDYLEREESKSIIHDIFTFRKADILSSDVDGSEGDVTFILGKLKNDYFEIRSAILNTKHSVYLHKDLTITEEYFVAQVTISVFKRIDDLVEGPIYIGGDNPKTIKEQEFRKILKEFPTKYEIKKYAEARLSFVLKNHFDNVTDAEDKYNKYMNRKTSTQGDNLLETLKEEELLKYNTISEKLDYMLTNETSYNEKQWQIEILQIILLLYPKYIKAFKEVTIRDKYQKKDRRLDFMLVGSNGHIDVIEIKRPMSNSLVSSRTYRDNYVPEKELSSTIMQIEKYIFHLNKLGKSGETSLTEKYKKDLPRMLKLKITNPKGIIIMGREDKLSVSQKDDFEVIKRKYQSIIDIISYDELVRRVKFMIEQLKRGQIIS
jgi:hypothetical protein